MYELNEFSQVIKLTHCQSNTSIECFLIEKYKSNHVKTDCLVVQHKRHWNYFFLQTQTGG